MRRKRPATATPRPYGHRASRRLYWGRTRTADIVWLGESLRTLSQVGASVQTVPAALVLSRRSLALGRPACSSRKPSLRLRFPLQNGAGSPCGLRDHSRPPRNIRDRSFSRTSMSEFYIIYSSAFPNQYCDKALSLSARQCSRQDGTSIALLRAPIECGYTENGMPK
jgi:hypothetical protein